MRVKGLNFIPRSYNFSTLPEGQEESLTDNSIEELQIDKEMLLLNIVSKLGSDKERCVFLFELLRELGYQIDYKSAAKSIGIEWRWYMRVKASMKDKAKNITSAQLKEDWNEHYGV